MIKSRNSNEVNVPHKYAQQVQEGITYHFRSSNCYSSNIIIVTNSTDNILAQNDVKLIKQGHAYHNLQLETDAECYGLKSKVVNIGLQNTTRADVLMTPKISIKYIWHSRT